MKAVKTLVALLAMLSLFVVTAYAESPSPDEIIKKVNEAADFLAQKGEEGLPEFNNAEGPWVFKDTYVFVYNCSKEIIAAHINNKLIGYNLGDLVDKKSNYLGLELCAAAEDPNGAWTEYWWPKAGNTEPERKISYIKKVPGQPYEVGAGIYEPDKTLDELNAMVK